MAYRPLLIHLSRNRLVRALAQRVPPIRTLAGRFFAGESLVDAIYLTVSQGFGAMPSLVENLTPRQRWDVINYIRNLQSRSRNSEEMTK